MEIKISQFCNSNNEADEEFFTIYSKSNLNFGLEASEIINELVEFAKNRQLVWVRFHLSDIANQFCELESLLHNKISCACSFVGQAPANGSKIALEAYAVRNHQVVVNSSENVILDLNNYKLNFFNSVDFFESNSYLETQKEFEHAQNIIESQAGTIENNLIRTWIYCRDIDNNYSGMVNARNDFFAKHNLNSNTHYIASTGIEGRLEPFNRLVKMDSLALFGHESRQIEYMKALDYLSPTHIYGVAFERGTRIIYGDRSHYYISGTASIDKDGKILHINDVANQTRRMIENVEALLKNHGGNLLDIKEFVVYLRDSSDYNTIKPIIHELLPENIPHIIVNGAVCRPKWLIEMDAIAINNNGNKQFKDFI